MLFVNFVFDDEELLEPYEWQEDDYFEEIEDIPLFKVDDETLHDFLYDKLEIMDNQNDCFVVSNGSYCVVIRLKENIIIQRGTLSFIQSDLINKMIKSLELTRFKYTILEEAYEKEFGLTRYERMKKMCVEEVIDEIFVVHYDLFLKLCRQLNICEESPSEQYLSLKKKLEKGYSSLHELLYKEFISKG